MCGMGVETGEWLFRVTSRSPRGLGHSSFPSQLPSPLFTPSDFLTWKPTVNSRAYIQVAPLSHRYRYDGIPTVYAVERVTRRALGGGDWAFIICKFPPARGWNRDGKWTRDTHQSSLLPISAFPPRTSYEQQRSHFRKWTNCWYLFFPKVTLNPAATNASVCTESYRL